MEQAWTCRYCFASLTSSFFQGLEDVPVVADTFFNPSTSQGAEGCEEKSRHYNWCPYRGGFRKGIFLCPSMIAILAYSQIDDLQVPRRESARPVKKPAHFIDYTQLPPRYKGKVSESMKYCQKVLHELMGKKCKVSKLFVVL